MTDAQHRTGDDRSGGRPPRIGTGDEPPSGRQTRYWPHLRQIAGPPRDVSSAWDIPDGASDDAGEQGRPLASLVSFHYLRAAVRRRWRLCAVLPLLGLLLAGAYLSYHPAPRTATTTLMLIPQDQTNPSGEITTDISLLMKTRTVAQRTISALGLKITPEQMMNSVTATSPDLAEIVQLTMSAPTDAQAVRWLNKFSSEYLTFRAAIMSKQADVLITGYQKEIDDLQAQATELREQVKRLSDSGQSADQLTEAVTKLSQTNDQISTLQGTVDDQTLQQRATVSASRVIDPAAPTAAGGLRRKALDLASGLIGGLALAFCIVFLRAILSDRLWLRMEVASALKASVIVSARRIAPLPRLLRIARWLPWVKANHIGRAVDRQRVAGAIANAVPESGRDQSLAVLCLGNSGEMRFAVAAAAADLQAQGRMTRIVDLSDAGTVASAVAHSSAGAADEMPAVFRPSVIPSRAQGPTGIDAAWEDLPLANPKNRTTLILADFDPAIGVDHLRAWTDSVIVAVTADESSVELVRTAGDLVRSAGLRLRGAVLLGAVRDDKSSGIATLTVEESGDTSEQESTPPGSNIGAAGQQ